MSRTIDEKVISMQFDNRRFESNVKTSLSTLDKLKQSLKLDGASKGFENVSSAAKSFDMSPMGNGIEMVQAKFSALEVMAVTALANITNSVVNAGKKLVSAITIEPIKSGFQEYETQMNAVQTILANTQKEGTNVKIVNAALDDLNRYADKTIYNFTEMTRNIGTFTAAGVKLDTSVSAIKGIANLAAVSGSSSQQASTAMYQLSQAIASGTVRLMDWNSVVNAGMGGQVFQDALIRTSEHLKTGANAAIKAKGSFRESLQEGWLTTEVLTQTLDQFATAADTQEEYEAAVKKFVDKGYTQEEAKQIADMARTAGDAATKVKTFSQLIDTLKEALGSGWTESWRLIIGDFEEAKELWTQVSDYFSEVINKSSDARNELIKAWADGGGREIGIEAIKNAFEAVLRIIKPVKEAFREVFPRTTSDQLLKITKNIKDFTEKLKISDETADKLKRTFKGVFSVFDIFKKVLRTVGKAIASLLGSDGVSSLGSFLLDITAKIGDFFTSLNEGFSTNGVSGFLSKAISGISDLLNGAVGGLDSFGDVFSKIGSVISTVAGKIWDALKSLFGWITDNMSFNGVMGAITGVFAALTGKKIYGAASGIQEFVKKIFGVGSEVKSLKDKISEVFNSLHESLTAFTSGIKVSSLVAIAVAIGILAASMNSIAKLKTPDIIESLGAIGAALTILHQGLKSVAKTLKNYNTKGVIKAAVAMTLMAFAVKVLASAIEKIGKLSLEEIAKGLAGVGGGLAELCAGLKVLNGVKITLRTSVAMLALAYSCTMLWDALKKFGDMQWDEIGRGLTAMVGALAELVIALGALNKLGGGRALLGSIGILITVQSLQKMADGLKKFSSMQWDEIGRGLTAMGGALLEVAGISGGLGALTGLSGILGAAAIWVAVQGLDDLANAFKNFGSMQWDEIGRGLTAMGGALLEVGGISGALGYLTGIAGVFGAGTIWVAVQGLDDLANALKKFGDMQWDEIGRGLTAMGGALLEVAGISGGLGALTGLSGILGGKTLKTAITGLDDLANALKKFGEMDWDAISRGLTAMGGALGETALGAIMNTFSFFGAGAIADIAKPLGDLADSVKKWTGVTVPEGLGDQLSILASGVVSFMFTGSGANSLVTVAPGIGVLADSIKKWTGVTVPDDLGNQLTTLASGVVSFIFTGSGANAIVTVAPGIGVLADSIKKWSGVTVPDGLGDSLSTLAVGISEFTFGGWGADTIIKVAPAIGKLASSVQTWKNVQVPEDIGTQLSNLAGGINAFDFAFLGAWSIDALVEPLANLAGSVRKWKVTTVPEDIDTQLGNLAKGVKKFSWSFTSAWSISDLVDPLGKLADSVRKWNGVTVPDDMDTQLGKIADGLKSFTGIGNISVTTDGMSEIAKAAKVLSNVNFGNISNGFASLIASITDLSTAGPMISSVAKQISSSISDLMTGIANSINASGPMIRMAFSNVITTSLSAVTANQQLFYVAGANSIRGFANGIVAGSGSVNVSVSSFISNIISAISRFQGLFQIEGNALMTRFYVGMNAGMANAQVSVSTAISRIITNLNSNQGRFQTAGTMLMTRFNSAIVAGGSKVSSTINALFSRTISLMASKSVMFQQIGLMFMERMKRGVIVGGADLSIAIRAILNSVTSTISNCYQSFYDAGVYLGDGLVDGIESKETDAYNAGYALGQAAVQGEKDGQQSNSPSKLTIKAGKWMGEGLVIGMDRMTKSVYKAGENMGGSAVDSVSSALERISNSTRYGMDVQPKIRPVVDLSDARATNFNLGAAIDFSMTKPITSLSQVVSDVQSKIDASNREVVAAINSLREDLAEFYSSDGQEIGLYVDSKKLASSIAKPMNRELNILSKRGAY